MCRTCGAIPSTPFESSARRCSTPKRCCSSTTQRPSRAKRDVGLDQRVGADEQTRARRSRAGPGPRLRRAAGVAPVSSANGSRLFGEQPVQGHRVLLGERLGRRHQHRLEPGFQRPQHRVERDHGLARPDLPHQQPLHRLAGVEVAVDLVERLQLVARSARTAATRPSARPAPRACPSRGAGARCGGSASASPGSPGRGRALRSEPLPGRARPPRSPRGSAAALTASADAGQPPPRPAARPAAARSRCRPSCDRLLDPLAGSAAPSAVSVRRDGPGREALGLSGGPASLGDELVFADPRSPRLSACR